MTALLIPCRRCGGEGFIEHGPQNAPDADWVERCEQCAATCIEEVEGEEITEEDCDIMSGRDSDKYPTELRIK